jgi:sigma-E factor negative regulatory protein RseA
MNEELSALVDGELQDGQLAGHLQNLKDDAEQRAAWDTCHLIGDVLRGHIAPEICSRVAMRLAEEPTVLAPRAKAWNAGTLGGWAMSIAAGVAAVALVVWTVLPAMRSDFQIAQQRVAPPQSVAPPMPLAAAPPAAQVADYLLAHQRYSATSAMQGVAPYVRTVSDER